MALFESYDRRIDHINAVLNEYGINGIEDAKAICDAKGIDPYTMCKETQPICFENACWAYVVGAAIAIKKGCTNAAEAAEAIGIGLQALIRSIVMPYFFSRSFRCSLVAQYSSPVSIQK